MSSPETVKAVRRMDIHYYASVVRKSEHYKMIGGVRLSVCLTGRGHYKK